MKYFFSLLISFTAQAATYDFKCQTNPKTTTFTFAEDGDDMVLTTEHTNGIDYMPTHDGITTPSDLPYLTQASTALKNMGAKNQFRFPKARCKTYGPGLLSCSGGERKKLNGVEMQALSLIVKKITTEVFDFKVSSLKVTLDVNIENFVPVQEITMEYDPSNCQMSF